MKPIEIFIYYQRTIQKALIEIDRRRGKITFTTKNGPSAIYESHDMFTCFGLLRGDFPHIKFLCKGAKLNVYPSRMAFQMSAGLVAYEQHMGRPAESEDLVRIFDYENKNITNNIQHQRQFHELWLDSFMDS